MGIEDPRNKILIVDDSRSVVMFMRENLIGNYDVREAFSGQEALTMLESFIPDLILMDIRMPGMDGITLCKKIKSDKRYPQIKIIMVSGEKKLKDRLGAYDAGADDFMIKPVEIKELQAKVKVFLKIKNLEDRLNSLNRDLNEQVSIRTGQLLEAEKMAALGKHTAGIVHNLNNPLQSIMGYASLLRDEYPENEMIDTLLTASQNVRDMIVTVLHNTANENKDNLSGIDFNKLLSDQVEIFKANLFFKTEVSKKLKLKPLPEFLGIYSHFSQSLGNLIKNAIESMHHTTKKKLEINTSCDSEMIHIEISDTGHGIKKEDISKIFDPFYTTKPLISKNGEPTGTGLGLASTKEMIESYGGKIVVSSEEGKGTSFKIELPYRQTLSRKGESGYS